MTPKVLILRTAGTNCDAELAHAFSLAGAEPVTLHLNALIEQPEKLADFQIIGFPGGFSYGDDIAAGRILANRLRHHLYEPLLAAIDRGVPMIGICNGFQVLVKLDLLPDPHANAQTATLADNTSGRFQDRWVPVTVPGDTKCVWTRSESSPLPDHELPIAHAEGRFVAPDDVLDQLQANGQVALRYADAAGDVNGSRRQIAGICDPTGLVFGLMPHPERFVTATQYPAWTRWPQERRAAESPGLTYFRNAVAHVAAGVPA
ncbi:MAG: phosphoribosylformylglycinamidine synthase subunit PurQ [Planctomycetota bacterium]